MKTYSPAIVLTAFLLTGCGTGTTSVGSQKSTANSTVLKKVKGEAAVVAGKSKTDFIPRTRRFRFNYGLKLKQLPLGAKLQVWMPVPPNNRYQKVSEAERQLPSKATIAEEPKYKNRILYFETEGPGSGELEFQITYDIERHEIRGSHPNGFNQARLHANLTTFLGANSKVPIDGKPLELLADQTLPVAALDLGRVLYDRVDEHMRYDKTNPGYGRGDVLWACDSRSGNCTDFHSLFISLARSQGLPARFEIGFSIPSERDTGTINGYHCWASFFVEGRGWVPTDISEADKHPDLKDYYFGNLTENRVTFSVGRDLELVPRQSGQPVNFFVYPYVEVDDKTWPNEKMETRFSYENAKPTSRNQTAELSGASRVNSAP